MRLEDRARLARFEAIALPHLDAAHNLARWLLGNPQDAEDAVQDSMVRALSYFDSFHGDEGRPWLLAIVRNTCYAWLRKNGHGAEPLDAAQILDSAPDSALDPEALQIRDAGRIEVQRSLQALPSEFREVLVLREMEELSYRQIARIIGVPIGTVMSRLSRARRRLQEILTGELKQEAR